jgi:hypothetical protein
MDSTKSGVFEVERVFSLFTMSWFLVRRLLVSVDVGGCWVLAGIGGHRWWVGVDDC